MEEILDDYSDRSSSAISKHRESWTRQKVHRGHQQRSLYRQTGLRARLDRQGRPTRTRSRDFSKPPTTKHEVKITKSYGKKKVDNDFSGFAGMMKMMSLLMGGEQQEAPQLQAEGRRRACGRARSCRARAPASFFGGETLGSETFIKAVRQAADEKTVKAIVLRVDSPGGSALASDLMWRALQKAGKPVIVSMGDVAASGGYYISMGANRIFAEPGTLTGSIGVVGGKVAIGGLLEKVGITTSVISRGKNSGAMSMLSGFSPTANAKPCSGR